MSNHAAGYEQAVTALVGQPRALPARQEVHPHFHGVTPAEVAAIIAEQQRPGRAR